MCKQRHRNALNPFLNGTKTVTLMVHVDEALIALLAVITNSDLRHGLQFDCKHEASLIQGARPPTDFKSSCI